VVFDPEKKVTISASTHHSASDYNLYEGTEVVGSPETVLLRGNVIVDGDQLLAKPGSGQFIKRARPNEELKPTPLATA
jgi:dihydropyrimidinase